MEREFYDSQDNAFPQPLIDRRPRDKCILSRFGRVTVSQIFPPIERVLGPHPPTYFCYYSYMSYPQPPFPPSFTFIYKNKCCFICHHIIFNPINIVIELTLKNKYIFRSHESNLDILIFSPPLTLMWVHYFFL